MSPENPFGWEVLGIGAPFMDHVIAVTEEQLQRLPGGKGGMKAVDFALFQEIIKAGGTRVTLSAGGSSANTIKGLANFGHRCAITGRIGRDDAGYHFLESLKRHGIASLLLPTETPTGQVACLVTPDGERTFKAFLAAEKEMRAEDLQPDFFTGVKLVHIEGYALINEGMPLRAMQMAKQAGAKVSFDLSSFELAEQYKHQIINALAKHVDVLFANADETKALTGLDPERGCDVLKDIAGIAVVLISKEGSWVGQGIKKVRCPAYPVNPLDTTGAGDMFAAGFLHGYLLGKPLEECAHYGALTAAEVVQVYGAEIPQQIWDKLRKAVA